MKSVITRKNPWHAIAVVTKTKGCQAVQALNGRRFLSGEAPALPLPNCTLVNDCQCRYQKYDDRRAGLRRDADEPSLVRTATSVATNKRLGRGRRASDLE